MANPNAGLGPFNPDIMMNQPPQVAPKSRTERFTEWTKEVKDAAGEKIDNLKTAYNDFATEHPRLMTAAKVLFWITVALISAGAVIGFVALGYHCAGKMDVFIDGMKQIGHALEKAATTTWHWLSAHGEQIGAGAVGAAGTLAAGGALYGMGKLAIAGYRSAKSAIQEHRETKRVEQERAEQERQAQEQREIEAGVDSQGREFALDHEGNRVYRDDV